MKLLKWLPLKMGYVLVPWQRYENMEHAHKMYNLYHDMLRNNRMNHLKEIETIKASYKDSNAREANIRSDYERHISKIAREYDDMLRCRQERIEALLKEVDRLQALLDESTKKYL